MNIGCVRTADEGNLHTHTSMTIYLSPYTHGCWGICHRPRQAVTLPVIEVILVAPIGGTCGLRVGFSKYHTRESSLLKSPLGMMGVQITEGHEHRVVNTLSL